jgi:hypothetical protein
VAQPRRVRLVRRPHRQRLRRAVLHHRGRGRRHGQQPARAPPAAASASACP